MSGSGGSSSSTSYTTNPSASNNIIYSIGQFESGFYNEELNTYAKGPVFSYSLSEENYLYAYGVGQLSLKNSSGIIEIQLEKRQNRRIVPTCISINGDRLPVINQHGEFVYSVEKVSIARTLNYAIDELSNRNIDQNIQQSTYHFLFNLLVFNLLTQRRVILDYNNQMLHIDEKYIYRLEQEVEEIRKAADDTVNKYSVNYAKDHTNKRVESLLSILELPINTKDIEVIKKQYRKLAKKYHPDVYGNHSDKKFKEVSDAFNELCELLKAG